jgi:hypothetical protein
MNGEHKEIWEKLNDIDKKVSVLNTQFEDFLDANDKRVNVLNTMCTTRGNCISSMQKDVNMAKGGVAVLGVIMVLFGIATYMGAV